MKHTEGKAAMIVWSQATRTVLGVLVVLVILVVLAGAVSIPFRFESSSMLYKFGSAKVMLQIGKVLGMVAGVLLLIQLLWSARIRFLDRIFGLNNLFRFHRLMGITIAACALLHPILVYLPDNTLIIPLTKRYWPELVGLGLLLCILSMAITSTFRSSLRLPYEFWRTAHRVAAVVVTAGLAVHVLNVSDSFGRGVPQTATYWAIGLWVLLFAWMTAHRFWIRIRPHTVAAVEPAGRDTVRLCVRPRTGRAFAYAPGQFAFIRIRSAGVRSEEHPFTIASSPQRPKELEFVIRLCGDWTRSIATVQPGDQISIDGPYGIFSHFRCNGHAELVMIAGGIGITPMLSMLRYMADSNDHRKITLIWSNKTKDDVVLVDTFRELESRLPGLRMHLFFTRGPEAATTGDRLNRVILERLLMDSGRDAAVFICGPEGMMAGVAKVLPGLGFSHQRIFTERFSL
ncbi:ferredoxin reductase family protein [Desulfobulbus alkaliphilus]|uniref:ferredoxin reductase family protein n=1 Tax=Desulfobulbus alkaliphilus TaxID=869814 RepID=UPI0019625A8E|nr:ferredoxin reductase family protein [Desulfobulbus alkaliphilus]MBM9535799.1 ferredoxin reductase family protein [Desulfobulbus alkaliphilus]